MSSIDTDLNHHTLGHHRRQGSAYEISPHSMGPSERHEGASVASPAESLVSPLQPITYDPYAHKRPVVSTNLNSYASNANINSITGDYPRNDYSPDPHDFYLRYQDPFSSNADTGLNRDDRMTTSRQLRRPSPSQRTNGTKFPSLSTRMASSQASRYPPSPSSADKSPLSASRSTPGLSSTARNRQTSLKDLVDRFNKTPDEVPPVPSKTQSRSTSTSSNPPGRARTSSQSKAFGQGPTSNPQQRRGRTVEERFAGQAYMKGPNVERPRRSTADELTSHSMTDLSPGANRKPLFGEIVMNNLNNLKPGYGIQTSRRRRGSEGLEISQRASLF